MADLRFREITYDDLQLLRYWRNSSHVREGMATRNLITVEGQRRWFETLDTKTNRHFVYGLGEHDIGSANIARIDSSGGTFEAGIYCGNDSFLKHWVNICACLYIYDFAFDSLGLSHANAIILDNNSPALSLNKSIGYRQIGKCAKGIGSFALKKDEYYDRRKNIRRYLQGQGISVEWKHSHATFPDRLV
jgi:RimJ/RimL family protein N-acetyltransferase